MRTSFIGLAVSSCALFASAAAGCSSAVEAPEALASSSAELRSREGAVYVLSNDPTNAVLVFDRASDGSLALAASVATGGAGSGDSLGSQGALTLSRDGRWLFAVNPGDHSVSALRVNRGGSLTLVDVADSGGDRPISVTEAWGLVYVLNAGTRENVSGLSFDGDQLRPIAHSTRGLSADSEVGPAEVAFDPDGDALVVTEKGTSSIDVFRLRSDATPDTARVSASAGTTPFGFAIDSRGTIVVSDAFGGAAGAGASSSYRLHHDAQLETVSGVAASGQAAPCWVAIDGAFAFVANTASGTVSSYAIARDGSLRLLGAAAATTGDGSAPADEAIAGSFLYVRDGGTHAISAFRVGDHGALTSAGAFGALPAHASGLVAR